MIQKTDLAQQIVALEGSKLKRLEPLRKWVLEANQAHNAVISDNWLEMKSFLQKVGSNRLLRAQTLTVSFKKPFDSLAETVVAVRDLADDNSRCSRWWRRRELNPRPKQTNQPRLHAYSKQGFLLCDDAWTRFALPSPHDIFSANGARSPPSTMPAMSFSRRSRCPAVNVVALGRESQFFVSFLVLMR